MGYIESSSWAVMAHTFNPNTGEVEAGRNMAGQKEEYKGEGDRSSKAFSLRTCIVYTIHSEDFVEVRTSGWLFCFSDLSAFNPHPYLTPGFYY